MFQTHLQMMVLQQKHFNLLITVSKILYNNNNHNNINIILKALCCRHEKVTATVHTVHRMNLEQHQVAVDPQIKPADLGGHGFCHLA